MKSEQVKKTKKKVKRTGGKIVRLNGTKQETTDRKKLAEQLKQYQFIVESAQDAIFFKDLKSRYIIANNKTLEAFGLSRRQVIGKDDYEIMPDKAEARKNIEDDQGVFVSGKPKEITKHMTGANGKERWFQAIKVPQFDDKGKVIGLVCVARDITERKKAEQALRESEKRYKYLFEQSPVGIELTTPDGKIVNANKTIEVITGYFEAELKKINLADSYENPQDRKRLLETIDRYGCAVDFPVRLKRKDGTVYDALLNVSRVHLDGKDLFQTICTDITERKKVEEALRSERNRLISVFEAMADGVYIVSQQHDIQYVNPVLIKDFGNWQERKCYEYFHDRKEVCPWCKNEQVWAGKTVRWEWYSFKNDRTYDLIDTPLQNPDGSISKLEIFRDITERKQAEQAINRSEKELKDIFENIAVGVYRTTPDGRILMANPALVKMLGYSSFDELAERNLQDGKNFAPHYARSEFIERIEKEGKIVSLESAWKKRNGSTLYIIENARVVRDEQGNTLYYEGTVENITERKKAEEALKESEQKYRTQFEEALDAIFIADAQTGMLIDCNRAACELVGRRKSEIIGEHQQILHPPEEIEGEFSKTFKQHLKEKQGQVLETQVITKNGEIKDVAIKANVFELNERKLIQGVFHNITERKQAEEEILKLAKFPSENPNPVLRIARDGTVLYANSASSAPLETWGVQVGQRLPEACYKRVREALSSGKVSKFEFVCHDGRIFEVTLSPVVESGYVNAYGLDITERKKAEEALRESEKVVAKGQLASEIAHELNNPLAGIKNSFLLIKGAIGRDHPYHNYLGLIDKEIGRISNIVRQMFDLSRPSEIEATEFSIDDTIREVVTLLGVNCRKHNVVIGISGKSAVATLPEVSLRQVLYNVVKNAIEASPPGGEVEITQAITEGVLTIRVCDEGDGISQEAQPHIFEPAFTTKEDLATAGLGLGLSISKNIVEEMGGSLYFESKTGQGTVFSIVIPLGKAGKGAKNG